MLVKAQFLKTASWDLRVGEARVLRVVGLGDGDTFVYLDDRDNVSRVQQGFEESRVVPWNVQQVLNDVLDPHGVEAG